MLTLTIDTGTTNSRCCVWQGDTVAGEASAAVGVRDTAITGNPDVLKNGVRQTISLALDNAGATLDEVDLVLASGMITSNLGLHELPHVSAPAGIAELAKGMKRVELADVVAHPIWFIPGVRNSTSGVNLENCESMDMMRGEEVETMGIMNRLGLAGPALVALPGSHSKFVAIDAQRRITGCITTIAGELLDVITKETILAKSVESQFAAELDEAMVREGALTSRRVGLARACFTVRILDQFKVKERDARANFLLGAVLFQDMQALKNSHAIELPQGIPVVIAGNKILKRALALLIRDDDFFNGTVTELSDSQQAHLAGYGALCVARFAGLMDKSGADGGDAPSR